MRSAMGLGMGLTHGAAGSGAAVPPETQERVQNGDFSVDTGWDTSGAAWTIDAGLAINNTAGQFLTNTLLVTPIAADSLVTATVVVTANPAAATWMISLYNTNTLAAQNIFSESGGTTGTFSNAVPVVASADYDAIRVRALADSGLVLDSVSVFA